MAIAVTITSVVREEAPSTRILVNFSDSNQLEFNDLAQMINATRSADTDVAIARNMLVAWWLVRDPDANTPAVTVVGKTLTFDLGQIVPIRVL